MKIRTAVLTVSDKGSQGLREDKSGPAIVETLGELAEIVWTGVVPDERERIAQTLRELADAGGADLILTTGGTGLAPRDVTPEATCDAGQRMVPGIAEAMRAESLRITPRGMLSRGVAVTRGRTLIVNLPGSPKAARECLAVLLPALPHGIEILCGKAGECGAPA
ncbi:MogA/MoaB family molybdenum cofactor biosynthesis protein [Butyricicoccus faecihominis]|uniref:MogA/MoaB family molybdenum cofactor biosynthesis protein n=1 Tax=Butyricicoccaceae TaxID=3085642 RepID=UPI0024798D27|nr:MULTISPECIES: MogA/MoaB family molybdenum cofactor biosynthesis protein [Butyricicoccaceae]MCQ5130050.1 MogA/MoaB family molybdenum cofactor biosynthesis protein [Butyricicoccus faecihominis]WNX85463.1 MogA/MoaB family molybdenum cofactor biosynthesis protein [Agathobaculum sp. NTUH-O15-33]